MASAGLHHIRTFYLGVLHIKKNLHHHDVSNSEMPKGTIVSLEKLEGKNVEISSTVHLSGLCELSDHFGDFVIMNLIMLDSQ
jgi:hypothetical protein